MNETLRWWWMLYRVLRAPRTHRLNSLSALEHATDSSRAFRSRVARRIARWERGRDE